MIPPGVVSHTAWQLAQHLAHAALHFAPQGEANAARPFPSTRVLTPAGRRPRQVLGERSTLKLLRLARRPNRLSQVFLQIGDSSARGATPARGNPRALHCCVLACAVLHCAPPMERVSDRPARASQQTIGCAVVCGLLHVACCCFTCCLPGPVSHRNHVRAGYTQHRRCRVHDGSHRGSR